jgi:hypothetical protein
MGNCRKSIWESERLERIHLKRTTGRSNGRKLEEMTSGSVTSDNPKEWNHSSGVFARDVALRANGQGRNGRMKIATC